MAGSEGDGRQDSGGGLLLKGLHLLSFVALIRFQWGPTFKEHSLKHTYPTSHLLLAAVGMFPKGTQNLQSHKVDTLIDTLFDYSKTAFQIQRLRNNTHSTVMPPRKVGGKILSVFSPYHIDTLFLSKGATEFKEADNQS